MADVSKLKAPDGTVLDIADLECRAELSTGFDYLSGQLALKANASDIPTVNNAQLTIQKNGTNVATFTANASSNVTANITVPTVNNGLLTIQKNGTKVAEFKANTADNVTANITVPKVVGGTIIITFNGSGYRDVALSAFSGLTSKPDSLILSAQSQRNCFIEYDWDSSNNTNLRIHGHGVNNSNILINLNGNVRVGWIAIDK